MTALEIVGLVGIVLISCLCIFGIIVAIPLVKLINKAKYLINNINTNLIPIIERLNTTVNNLNTEISSIVDLTQSASSIVQQLEKIVRLARLLITSPLVKIISTIAGIVEGVKKVASENEKEGKNVSSK